ncbi:MAG: carbohydrate ABC transporter permease [Rubrobacteraceae bacterium]|nr:carbohydrate ABC transporter permease [Rubrobacteraceae bacterium]MCL6438829.1 carbohydrate ABC transporter permease [Rubrobacteraceae bacterium]
MRRRDPQEILHPRLRVGVTAVFVVLILLPIAYMLLLSVTPDSEIGTRDLIPSRWAFDNYMKMWSTVNLGRGLINSLIISGTASVIAVIVAVGAAYVLSRFNFRGRFPFLYSLIALQSAPQVMLLLPLFVLFASVQTALPFRLTGTYQGPIITYLTFALPLAIWLMVSYLASIPVELEEAALVDGATRLQALRKIVVPLALPGMVVALVFSFLTGWNDVLFASALTSPSTRTLAVELQTFSVAQQGGSLPLYGQLMSAAVVSGLPVVILYMIFQRYLIGGLTAGGVKG